MSPLLQSPTQPFVQLAEDLNAARKNSDRAEMKRLAEIVLEEEPQTNTPFLFTSAVQVLLVLDRPDDAEQVISRGLACCSPRPALYVVAAKVAEKRERLDEARRRLESGMAKFGPDVRIGLPLAQLLTALGDKAAVRRLLVELAKPSEEENSKTAGLISIVFAAVRRLFAGFAKLHNKENLETVALISRVFAAAGFSEFSKALADRFDNVRADFGRLLALQNIRNVLYTLQHKQLAVVNPDLAAMLLNKQSPILNSGIIEVFVRELENDLIAGHPARETRTATRPDAWRILIGCSYMPGNKVGPHMRFVNSIAAGLAHASDIDRIVILLTQEFGPEGPRVQDGVFDEAHHIRWREDINALAGEYAGKIDLFTPNRSGPVHPVAESLEIGRSVEADALIAIQGIYASTVTVPVLAAELPTIAVQVSSDNREPAYADLVLAHANRRDFSDQARPNRWRKHTIPVLPFEMTGEACHDALGSPVGVRIATALSNGRIDKLLLNHACRRLDQVVDFLARNPKAGWSFIGVENFELLQKSIDERCPPDVAERIGLVPFQSNLRAALANCDIYFLKDGVIGGGMATALAIAEGVSVLVPSANDSANFLPDESQYDGQEEGFTRLKNLVKSPAQRRSLSALQTEFLEEHHSLTAYAKSFPKLLHEAHGYRHGNLV